MISLVSFVSAFCIMEFMAWFAHKFVMHGFLWSLHEDHHTKTPGFFEKNDFFFLMFAVPSFLLILFGSLANYDWRFYFGAGIAAYGFAYAMMHEIIIHQRFKWLTRLRTPYIQAARRAHADHHRVRTKEGCVSFGMLVFPRKYLKDQRARV